MARDPRTAEQMRADVTRSLQREGKEKRDADRRRAELENIADMRDDIISLVRNSGLSFEDIHAACGPHPTTLQAWADKKVTAPRLSKMQATARILGWNYKLVPIEDKPTS